MTDTEKALTEEIDKCKRLSMRVLILEKQLESAKNALHNMEHHLAALQEYIRGVYLEMESHKGGIK